MLLDDTIADRKAEPASLSRFLGAEKWIENLVLDILADPGTVILNLYDHTIVLSPGPESNDTVVAYCLTGIHNQVKQYLFQSPAVHKTRGDRPVQAAGQSNLFFEELPVNHGQYIFDDVVY